MISLINGIVRSISSDRTVVEVGGVGLSVSITTNTSTQLNIGAPVQLFTSLVVREDSLTLFGFLDEESRSTFELVQTVTGIGPKVALAIMGSHSPQTLAAAIAQEDANFKPPYDGGTKVHPDELACMARNIYFEAKSEPLAGQYAVADVVLNRVNDTRYPNSICEVVREGPIKESWKTRQHADLPDDERIYHPIKNRCQFSWYCDGKADTTRDSDAWRQAQIIAYKIDFIRRSRT